MKMSDLIAITYKDDTSASAALNELSQLQKQQVIALAGVAQAARLVDQLSKTGSYPQDFLEASIHSLFEFEPDSVEQIFGGLPGVKLVINVDEDTCREIVSPKNGIATNGAIVAVC